MFRIILTGACALSAAIAMSASARAADHGIRGDGEGGSIKLQYAEADLYSAQGANALAVRIRLAADRACRGEALLVSHAGDLAGCRERTVARVIKDLDAPLLAAALEVSPPRPAITASTTSRLGSAVGEPH